MKMTHLKYILVAVLYVGVVCAQSDRCAYYYKIGNTSQPWDTDFRLELLKNSGSLPIFVLDNYLKKRIAPLAALYRNVTDAIGRQGVDSKLEMQLKLFDKYFESTGKEIDLLSGKLKTAQPKKVKIWPFGRSKNLEAEVTDSIESLKSCKLGLDGCVEKITHALSESENFIKLAQLLNEDISSIYTRIDELSKSMEGHPDYTFFQSIFTAHQTSIMNIRQIVGSAIELEKNRLVTSILIMRTSYPSLQERFELLIAEHAGNKQIAGTNWTVIEPIPKVNARKADVVDTSKVINSVFALGSGTELVAFFKGYSEIVQMKESIKIPINEAMGIINNCKDYGVPVEKYLEFAGVSMVVSRTLRVKPLLAVYLASVTKPSEDILTNIKFIAKITAYGALTKADEEALQDQGSLTKREVLEKLKLSLDNALKPFKE